VPLLAHTALATNPLFQNQLGAADAQLRAARGLLYADAAAAWGTAVAGAEFTPEHRARMRAAITWAATTAASVVDMAYHAGGGGAIYAGSPLQRRFRDIHALTQHFLVKLDTFTTAGAVLAGAEADLTVF
jgi:indole-3-acetate monooxygenase